VDELMRTSGIPGKKQKEEKGAEKELKRRMVGCDV